MVATDLPAQRPRPPVGMGPATTIPRHRRHAFTYWIQGT
jgi:hypothetical protein